jgi:hypothetical protein
MCSSPSQTTHISEQKTEKSHLRGHSVKKCAYPPFLLFCPLFPARNFPPSQTFYTTFNPSFGGLSPPQVPFTFFIPFIFSINLDRLNFLRNKSTVHPLLPNLLHLPLLHHLPQAKVYKNSGKKATPPKRGSAAEDW